MKKGREMSKNDAPNMKGDRTRNKDGELRQKRSDTLVRTIEEQYNVDFGVRSDMKLGTLLEQTGIKSLNHLIQGQKE